MGYRDFPPDLTEAYPAEVVRIGQGQRDEGTELERALFAEIIELKQMVNGLIDAHAASGKQGLTDMVNILMNELNTIRNLDIAGHLNMLTEGLSELRNSSNTEMVNSLIDITAAHAEVIATIDPLQASVDRLRSAGAAMAAKVDTTATPSTSFSEDYSSLV